MKKIFTLVSMALLLAVIASAQQRLLTEDFNYSRGNLTAASGGLWKRLSGTTGIIRVVKGSLSYPGYNTSPTPTSRKIRIDSSSLDAEDVFTRFTSQDTGTVYCSFLVRVGTSHNL